MGGCDGAAAGAALVTCGTRAFMIVQLIDYLSIHFLQSRTVRQGKGQPCSGVMQCSCGASSCHQQEAAAEPHRQFDPPLGADARHCGAARRGARSEQPTGRNVFAQRSQDGEARRWQLPLHHPLICLSTAEPSTQTETRRMDRTANDLMMSCVRSNDVTTL